MTQIDTSPLAWLDAHAQQRRQAGLRRALRPRPAVATELDLASNDYLGLSQHPDVIDGGVDALRTWGAGATGSRLVTGNTQLHEELESVLAEFVGAAAGLVFSSGYAANQGAVVGLSGPGSLLVSDAYSHASLVDACRLSRARVVVTPHRDLDAVDAALASRDEQRAVVITESVFSTDGALAPVRELHEVCRRHRALLIVDEAHGLGVRGGGRGLLHELGLAGAPDVVMTTTLSKALGSQGGAVLGSVAVRDHLIDSARTFIFDTGLAPAAVGAALAALRVLTRDSWRPDAVLQHAATLAQICSMALGDDAGRRAARGGGTSRLRGRAGQLGPLGDDAGRCAAREGAGQLGPLGDDAGRCAAREGAGQLGPLGDDAGRCAAREGAGQLGLSVPQSAVVSVILGEPEVALAAATACLDAGVRVGCFRPPTVPAGTSRLRLTARASLDPDDLELARTVLTDVLSAARR